MRTVFLGELPPEIEDFLARRRQLGQDRHDEVWEGDYHVSPFARNQHGIVQAELTILMAPLAKRAGMRATMGFNLGPDENNFRVPDGGVLVEHANLLYVPTAALVIEVLSPDDETWEKFDFYASQGVREILVAHPQERWVQCFDLQATGHPSIARSEVLGIEMTELVAQVDWP